MKQFHKFICLIFLFLVTFSHGTYVAVLESMTDNQDILTLSERQYLTNILREQAVKTLPADSGYTIMTRENINMMLPPGKSIEDCEGSCLAETGKNIAADYVAQARIGRFGTSLSISVELYETATSKLVSSYNGRGEDLVALEQEIILKSADLFSMVRKTSALTIPKDGLDSLSLSIVSSPDSAVLYVDNRPQTQCPATPCQIRVTRGNHTLTLEKEFYTPLDSAIEVQDDNAELFLPMSPNFGTIELYPKLKEGFGDVKDVVIKIDESVMQVGKNNVKPGIHAIEISHPCYEPIRFKVGVGKASLETFEKEMELLTGGLSLDATRGGRKEDVSVFVDGKLVGKTPYLAEIPLCSRISVGDSLLQEDVPVKLLEGDMVHYVHQLPALPELVEQPKDDGSKHFWIGLTLAGSYNDFYDTKLGFGNLESSSEYTVSTYGGHGLLGNYWGIGGNVGLDILYMFNQYFGLHLETAAAFRSGSGKSNFTVKVQWNDSEIKEESSDLEIEMNNIQVNVDVPLLARVAMPGLAYFEVGPMASFNILAKSKVSIEDFYGEESYEEKNGLELFELDVAAGIGITRYIGSTMLDLGLRFVLGMTRLNDEDDAPKTMQLQLNATYWFL